MTRISYGKTDQIILEAHLIIAPRYWRRFTARLGRFLKASLNQECSVTPLYYSYDIEDLEIRICYIVSELSAFDAHIVAMRRIPGIVDTRVRVTLHGRIFPDNFKMLADSKQEFSSCHIFLKVSPRYDKLVWSRLERLSAAGGVCPVWLFRDYYEYDRDLTLRLIGPSPQRIRNYVESRVCGINGLQELRSKFMHGFVTIIDNKRLIEMAGAFI